MRAFSYVAFTEAGRRRKGTLVAESEAKASALLKAQGLYAETITADAPRAARPGVRTPRARVSAEMRVVFTRQLAVLLTADLSAEEALETVRQAGGAPALETAAATALAALMDGEPVSVSLERSGAGFPPYYIAAVRAGEMSGDLAAVFEKLADFLEQAGSDRAAMSTALIYPAFVATVALIVCGVLMVNVAPEIVEMFEVADRPLPPLTRVMLGISDWIQAHWIALSVAGAALVSGFAAMLRVPRLRDRWDGFVLRLPVFGRLLRMSEAAQYLRTLALILAARHPVVDAVESAADVLSVRRFRAEAAAVRAAVSSGESLSEGMAQMSLVPPVCRQLIHAGEQSARLARMAERAAVLVETWLINDRKRVVALMDPVLMMVVGAMVLVIVLSVLLPIFDLQSVVAGA